MVQQRLARVDELVRDLRLCVALGARRRRPPLLRRERRKGRDEKVPLQPPHLLVHLAHQVLGRCAGGELVEREAAQPLRPPVRTRRRRGGGGSLASACSRRAAAAGALARPAPRGAEQLWPAESVVFVVLCRRRRGLVALEDLRQSELPLVTCEAAVDLSRTRPGRVPTASPSGPPLKSGICRADLMCRNSCAGQVHRTAVSVASVAGSPHAPAWCRGASASVRISGPSLGEMLSRPYLGGASAASRLSQALPRLSSPSAKLSLG